MRQNSVILAILKTVQSIFGHRLECTKPESSRLQNIGVDSGLRLPVCDTGCRRTYDHNFGPLKPLRVSGSMVDPVET